MTKKRSRKKNSRAKPLPPFRRVTPRYYLLTLGAFFVCLVLYFYSQYSLPSQDPRRSWPKVNADVTSLEILAKSCVQRKLVHSHLVEFGFQFDVNGARYSVPKWRSCVGSHDHAVQYIKALTHAENLKIANEKSSATTFDPSGLSVPIYYNPSDPNDFTMSFYSDALYESPQYLAALGAVLCLFILLGQPLWNLILLVRYKPEGETLWSCCFQTDWIPPDDAVALVLARGKSRMQKDLKRSLDDAIDEMAVAGLSEHWCHAHPDENRGYLNVILGTDELLQEAKRNGLDDELLRRVTRYMNQRGYDEQNFPKLYCSLHSKEAITREGPESYWR